MERDLGNETVSYVGCVLTFIQLQRSLCALSSVRVHSCLLNTYIYILEDTIGTSSCSKGLTTMVGFQTRETQSLLLLKCSGGLHFLLTEVKALIGRQ